MKEQGEDEVTSSSLPSLSSPCAMALYAAFDNRNNSGSSSSSSKTTKKNGAKGGDKDDDDKHQNRGGLIRRITRTLGWRNRHSQVEYYPIRVTSYNDADGEEEKEEETKRREHEFRVRQHQRGEVDGTYGTGATVWPASMVLIKYLELQQQRLSHTRQRRRRDRIHGDGTEDVDDDGDGDNKNNDDELDEDDFVVDVRGRRVIDLGCGTGAAGIAAAVLGARHVVCTDGTPSVVRLARDNVALAEGDLRHDVDDGGVVADDEEEGEDDDDEKNKLAAGEETSDDEAGIVLGCPISVQEYWWGTGSIRGYEHRETDRDDSTTTKTTSNKTTAPVDSGAAVAAEEEEEEEEAAAKTMASERKAAAAADVILVSDCVLPKLYPIEPLAIALDQLLIEDGSVALLSYEHRHYDKFHPKTEFIRLVTEGRRRRGDLIFRTVPRRYHHPAYTVDDIELWIVRRRKGKNSSTRE